MKPHLQYLWYVLRHKWFVFVAGLHLRVPLMQLITHDWSKFLPSEWGPYVAYFYGEKLTDEEVRRANYIAMFPKSQAEIKADFDRAWNHHQKRQPHHWQYWLLITDQPGSDWALWSHNDPLGPFILAYKKEAVGEFYDDERPMTENRRYLLASNVRTALNRAPVALPMPERYVREMVADWCGAGRAITGKWEVAQWYTKTRDHIILHPSTRRLVEDLIAEVTLQSVPVEG